MESSDSHWASLHHLHSPSRETLTEPHQKQKQNLEVDDPLLPLHLHRLSFPTLNNDGSIRSADLTAHQSRHHQYPPTPPAALSTLGIRAKMAGDTTSESDGSFADSQYDMIDDLSDTSNDDHDTASITSHDGPSGQLTPDYAQSEADDTEERAEQPEHNETITLSPSAESFIALSSAAPECQDDIAQSQHQMKAENDLIDSYTSEDLETPRQSTLTNAFASTYHLSQRKTASHAVQPVRNDPSVNHILFVSDRDIAIEDMDAICAKAAFGMDPVDLPGSFEYQVVRLPATPSGLQARAKIMRAGDGISATFQHCVGAETRKSSSYQLLLVDSDEESGSYFTIGPEAKIDLPTPKLAIFYLDAFTHGKPWFDTAYKAMQDIKVPILVIHDSDFVATKPAAISYGEGESQLKLDANRYMAMGSELKTSIGQLLGEDLASVPPPRRKFMISTKFKELRAGHSVYFRSALLILGFVMYLANVATQYQYFPTAGPVTDPAADLLSQREALIFALDRLGSSANIPQGPNTTYLLPAPPTNCTQSAFLRLLPGHSPCPVEARLQHLPPNHAVISLTNLPRRHRVVSVEASRDDDHLLVVKQTKLIPDVYHLALDPNQAYGTVNFTMITHTPYHVFNWSSSFGSRLLQLKTYERAGTDISKAVGKDVAVMRHAAKDITEKVSTEIGAGLWATKNVTSQLALYVTRDIQLAANTAVSVFTNAAKASNKTASNLGKDLSLMQKDIVTFGESVSESLKSRINSVRVASKALVRVPVDMSKQRLVLSRERVQRLKKALSRSPTKEPAVTKENYLLSKFETYLAATPEHELLEKQKPGNSKKKHDNNKLTPKGRQADPAEVTGKPRDFARTEK